VRDVTVGEDGGRIRKGSGPEIMVALRNAAIGFLRIAGATNVAETIRRNASGVQTLFSSLGILN
jgi:hypothetical protein